MSKKAYNWTRFFLWVNKVLTKERRLTNALPSLIGWDLSQPYIESGTWDRPFNKHAFLFKQNIAGGNENCFYWQRTYRVYKHIVKLISHPQIISMKRNTHFKIRYQKSNRIVCNISCLRLNHTIIYMYRALPFNHCTLVTEPVKTNHKRDNIPPKHYCDVIMGPMVPPITSPTIAHSTVHSDAHQRKHQSSASLAFVRGIHRWLVKLPNNWPVTRKCSIWWRHHDVNLLWWAQQQRQVM